MISDLQVTKLGNDCVTLHVGQVLW